MIANYDVGSVEPRSPDVRLWARQNLRAAMALLHWIEDWTIVNELLVVWLVLLPPLAVFV